jgi:hypothetical protein
MYSRREELIVFAGQANYYQNNPTSSPTVLQGNTKQLIFPFYKEVIYFKCRGHGGPEIMQ